MSEPNDSSEETPGAQRIAVVTDDEAFAAAMATALDHEGRLVEPLSPTDLRARFDETCYDGVLVDHDGETVSAEPLVRDVRAVDTDVPVVVFGPPDAGAVASDALAAGATTFVSRTPTADSESLAERVESALGRPVSTHDRAATYRTLVDDALASADVGLVVSDADGTVRWATEAVGAFFGVPTGRLTGLRRRMLIRERFAPAVADSSAFSAHLLDPDGTGSLVRTAGVDRARWLDCRSSSLVDGPFAGGRVDRFVDVSRFVRADDGLRELHQLMVTDGSFAERLHEVLSLGSDRLDLPYGFVTAIDDGQQEVLDAIGDHELLQPGQSAPLLQTYCRRTLAADGLVTIADAVAAGWENDPAFETFDLGSYIGAPIRIDGDHYGTLCFASGTPRAEFGDEETLFVEFAAAWAGWELERYGTSVS